MSRKITGLIIVMITAVFLPLVLSGCLKTEATHPSKSSAWTEFDPDKPLGTYPVNGISLRILTPDILELIHAEQIKTSGMDLWHPDPTVLETAQSAAENFVISVNGQSCEILQRGYKRRVLSASSEDDDLRVGNFYYLQLKTPLSEGDLVSVSLPAGENHRTVEISKAFEGGRRSPVIHTSQAGYIPGYTKKAYAGYYLGSMGELHLQTGQPFTVIENNSGKIVFEGTLQQRKDDGWKLSQPPYQHVFEADFSELDTPGEYLIRIPGLGLSYPFMIDASTAAAYARTYALGLYHQRCGTALNEPYTRFTHSACHLPPAAIPSLNSDKTAYEPPSMKNVPKSLYDFIQTGEKDVSGGHHDAGDYSKYTINSAAFIHYLTFAADVFPHVMELDNLGLPESGDGFSDLLQEAQWEADFLIKMQDKDGGFYFLVYPYKRPYEDNVLPENGDPQVVFPKTTAATAAASAALAQLGSSPGFKKIFPQRATDYIRAAERGWEFIEKARMRYGAEAYQKITHYGDWQKDNDEIAWAAVELFLATGNTRYQQKLLEIFDPSDPSTRHWQWQRLFESYGNAVRSYAFAVESGRRKAEELDAGFRTAARKEIIQAANDLTGYSKANAYGMSYPFAHKRAYNAGWFFPGSESFDLVAAYLIEPNAAFLKTVILNLTYEGGANPNNISFITGLGLKRQYHIVHQYAINDKRLLPPSGIPVGALQDDIPSAQRYRVLPKMLSYPADNKEEQNYPLYDRWSDMFNVKTEFTIPVQGRALAVSAYFMGQTEYARQPWKSGDARIIMPDEIKTGMPLEVKLQVENLDFQDSEVVWEINGNEAVLGKPVLRFTPQDKGLQWIEAEFFLKDGRRLFARKSFRVR